MALLSIYFCSEKKEMPFLGLQKQLKRRRGKVIDEESCLGNLLVTSGIVSHFPLYIADIADVHVEHQTEALELRNACKKEIMRRKLRSRGRNQPDFRGAGKSFTGFLLSWLPAKMWVIHMLHRKTGAGRCLCLSAKP